MTRSTVRRLHPAASVVAPSSVVAAELSESASAVVSTTCGVAGRLASPVNAAPPCSTSATAPR